MMVFFDLFNVGVAIKQGVRTFFGTIAALLYDFIVDLYNIFITLTTVNVVENSYIREVYNKVGLILGLFMAFKLSFSLVTYFIEPEKMSDKKTGAAAIIKRFVIAIVLLGSTPAIFNMAFDFQKLIVGTSDDTTNVIYRFFIGDTVINDTNSFGQRISSDLFFSFYNETYPDALGTTIEPVKGNNGWEYDIVDKFDNLKSEIESCNRAEDRNCSFNRTVDYLGVKADNGSYAIDWNGLFSIGVAVVVIWILCLYCIQVAVRTIQLAYLQIIAPIPIISYISDPDGTFKKWTTQCIATYLDLFFRVSVIYFILTIAVNILDIFNSVKDNDLDLDINSPYAIWIKIFLIIGLFLFGKKVPELIKDLFPNLGGGAGKFSFGLNPKKVFNDTMAAGLIGGTVGALGAGASNAIHGFRNIGKVWKKNGISMKKWNDLTDEERKGLNEKDYNAERRNQMWRRAGVVTGAGFKSIFSIAGGVAGGAKAGLKTKDITKSGEAIKTANKNREERELRKEAGYHVWNTARDKILEFAGESGYADIVKNRQQAVRDERQRQSDLDDGERLYYTFGVPEPGSNERKLDANRAFKHSEYQKSYKQLKDAKGDAKEAELVLQHENARLNSAYNNPNLHSSDSGVRKIAEDELTLSKERYEIAYGNNKAMQGKLELAKAKHDSNKKIYIDDAKVEDLFKFYADTHAELKPLEASDKPGSNPSVSSTSKIDINAYLNNGFTEDEKPIDISPTDLAKIKEKLVSDLNAQEEVLSNAMRAQRDAMAKTPFSDESKEAQSKTKNEEAKRDLISEQLANVEQLINSVNNKVTKLSKKERSKLEAQMRKAESEGNATEQARIEKILIEDDKLSE